MNIWILLRNIDLRCFVARQYLSQIYALFGVNYSGLRMALAYKKLQISGMHMYLTFAFVEGAQLFFWLGGGSWVLYCLGLPQNCWLGHIERTFFLHFSGWAILTDEWLCRSYWCEQWDWWKKGKERRLGLSLSLSLCICVFVYLCIAIKQMLKVSVYWYEQWDWWKKGIWTTRQETGACLCLCLCVFVYLCIAIK